MGIANRIDDATPNERDLLMPRVEFVLGAAELEALKQQKSCSASLLASATVLELDEPLPDAIAKRASVICIEVSRESRASVERVRRLRQRYPDLPTIALVRDPNVALVRTLMRLGVKDVIELPALDRQVDEAIAELLANLSAPAPQGSRHGKIISVVKSTGGVGATNVAINLAKSLIDDQPDLSACLLDLDLQFGNAATYLGAPTKPSLTELLEGGARVDNDFLRTVATRLPSGLHFVPPPSEIGPLEAIDLGQLKHVLSLVRTEFDYAVLDMPSNWANWTLSIVAESDAIILVVNLTIASLRQGQRQLALLKNQGIDPQKIIVLVNRVERRLFRPIRLDDAAEALGHPVALVLHNDYALMSSANNQGVAAIAFNPKSTIARDYARIAQALPALVVQGN